MFLFDDAGQDQVTTRIKVIGVGGGGSNAIDNMIKHDLTGLDLIATNTDRQALTLSESAQIVQLGAMLTRGRGAGGRPMIGREAAIETVDQIREVLYSTDMAFITAGMGGGTGTGAAPEIAKIAKEMGILTVGVVTKPFDFEGAKRAKQAEAGIKALQKACHSVIVIPNQRLLSVLERGTSLLEAFAIADDILRQAVQSISDLITRPGLMNLDFADIRTVMSYAGQSVIGLGSAKRENHVVEAAKMAISSPLLEADSIEGARGILLNIRGGEGLPLHEISEAASMIQKCAAPQANIIFGSVISKHMTDEVRVTLIVTGLEATEASNEIVKKSRDHDQKPINKPPNRESDQAVLLQEMLEDEMGEASQNSPLIEMNQWDVPTFLRNRTDKQKNSAFTGVDDLDIPTFLRKRMDKRQESAEVEEKVSDEPTFLRKVDRRKSDRIRCRNLYKSKE